MKALRLSLKLMAIEWRKILSYRFDFWSSFIGSVTIEILMAWFVWTALFEGKTTIRGLNFQELMFYSSLTPVLMQVLQSQTMHFMSEDIYQGSLTKYLVLPLNFVHAKFVAHITFGMLGVLQLLLAIGVMALVLGVPGGLSVSSFVTGVAFALAGSSVFFLMVGTIEMVAFWADNVWSLNVMLRLCMRLLGGAVVPLSMFPERWQAVVEWLPFWSMGGLPVQVILGHVVFEPRMLFPLLIWGVIAAIVMRIVWKSGLKTYSGVGI